MSATPLPAPQPSCGACPYPVPIKRGCLHALLRAHCTTLHRRCVAPCSRSRRSSATRCHAVMPSSSGCGSQACGAREGRRGQMPCGGSIMPAPRHPPQLVTSAQASSSRAPSLWCNWRAGPYGGVRRGRVQAASPAEMGGDSWQGVNVARFAGIGAAFTLGLEALLFPMFSVATKLQFQRTVRTRRVAAVVAVHLAGHCVVCRGCAGPPAT